MCVCCVCACVCVCMRALSCVCVHALNTVSIVSQESNIMTSTTYMQCVYVLYYVPLVYNCDVFRCVHLCGFGCVPITYFIDIFVSGCTSFKPVLEYLNGLVEANQTLRRPDIHGPNSRKILLKTLSQPERERRLKTYYKFMILRDPLERMMSAYKDKVCGLSIWEQGHMYTKGV